MKCIDEDLLRLVKDAGIERFSFTGRDKEGGCFLCQHYLKALNECRLGSKRQSKCKNNDYEFWTVAREVVKMGETKPTIGVEPQKIWIEKRARELSRAIHERLESVAASGASLDSLLYWSNEMYEHLNKLYEMKQEAEKAEDKQK